MRKNARAFTLIELMVTMLIVAILMIPISMMMMDTVRSVGYEDSIVEALALARQEMAVVTNEALADFDSADLQYQDPPKTTVIGDYDVKRIITHIKDDESYRIVTVRVCPHGSDEELVELVTYILRGVTFGAGSGGL